VRIDTIYRWIRQKRLAAVRAGNLYRIRRSEYERFLETNSTKKKGK